MQRYWYYIILLELGYSRDLKREGTGKRKGMENEWVGTMVSVVILGEQIVRG